MKKVLIITYHFPPDAAVGANRPAKFAKFLPEFGWEPIIYTVKERYYETCDCTKFEPALKNIKIYRANLIPGPLHVYSRFLYHRRTSSNNLDGHPLVKTKNQNGARPIKRLISSLFRLPDENQGWIFNILIDGYRIMKDHKISVFTTSGPPMSTHVGGLLLKSMTHAKWVADFRDPWWPTRHNKNTGYRTNFSISLEKWLQAKVVRKADVIVSTTPKITKYFRLILPAQERNKCRTITNGFDDDDFMGIEQSPRKVHSKIRVSHVGTLYVHRNPEPFFGALNGLLNKGLIRKEDIEIDLIGNCTFYNGVSVQELIDKYELSSTVRLLGTMPFRKCIESQVDSDALLLFAQGQPAMIPAKVFEYIKINKPILALTESGETKRILEDFENAFIADGNKVSDIAEKFLQLVVALKNGKNSLGPPEKMRQYDRRNLTETFAGYIDIMDQS